jgi:hypothetical protein
MLVSAVETRGTSSWAEAAADLPGQSEIQCYSKWQSLSRKAAITTSSGTWTREEEKKLVSAVETFGANHWATIAVTVPGRNESQCYSKWRTMSTKKVAHAATGQWTVEEETNLTSAVGTYGTTSWANVASKVPGRKKETMLEQVAVSV